MKKVAGFLIVLFLSALRIQGSGPQNSQWIIKAKNELDVARPSETIVIAMKDILKSVKVSDWKNLHVAEAGSGQEFVTQAIDMDGDGTMDLFLFQADFKSGETKSFTLKAGDPKILTKEQFKAYGRFVRERYDDFAWENDRIAHRMYGKALETWQAEPLTSSTVDVWTKRVRRLVINDWYMLDNYHNDNGDGADFYSAGTSRGCGGNGIWEDGKLFVSRNFIDSKVIANGPLRVVFELTYGPWDVNGRKVSEVKRVTLDAGQNFDRFESFYKSVPDGQITCAIGIKNFGAASVQSNREEGWLRTWEPLQNGKSGNLGCAVLLDPGALVEFTKAGADELVIARVPAGQPAAYCAGFGWDRSGDFVNMSDWDAYLRQFAQRLRSPLEISVSPQ
jgi:pectinesterase